MDERRLSNLLVFIGRAGAASIILVFAAYFFLTPVLESLAVGGVLALADAFLWRWAFACPLWVIASEKKLRVRWVFSEHEYVWSELNLFVLNQTTSIKGIETEHCFVHIRVKTGKWFKVRVNAAGLDFLKSIVPESGLRQSIVRNIASNG